MKLVKRLSVSMLFVFIQITCLSQTAKRNSLKDYIDSKFSGRSDYPYITFGVSLGGKIVRHCMYYQKDTLFVLAIFEKNYNTIEEIFFDKDELFHIVNTNLEYLKETSKANITMKDYKRKFKDKNNFYTNVGIRYKDLHSNHYQKVSQVAIDNEKNQNFKKGYQTISLIANFFETKILKTPALQ